MAQECLNCGGKLGKNKKYCCKKCLCQSNGHKKKNAIERYVFTCKQCEKQFSVPKYRIKTVKYCSKECLSKSKKGIIINPKAKGYIVPNK